MKTYFLNHQSLISEKAFYLINPLLLKSGLMSAL